MDPEFLLPVALVFAGLVGAASRRRRNAPPVAASTMGQKVAGAGESMTNDVAAGLGATARAGVNGAAKLAARAGAATSALTGLVIDGGVAAVSTVGGPMARGAGRAVSGAARALHPRSKASLAIDDPGSAAHGSGDSALVVTSARGKRFHRPACSLAPVGAVAIPRAEALAGARQPCPTCQP
jgi:hypothetical protein